MKHAKADAGQVTLADLIRDGRTMRTYCCSCGKERDTDPATIALAGSTPILGLGRRHMCCTACGSREIDTKPERALLTVC